jgi:hypothetical protein
MEKDWEDGKDFMLSTADQMVFRTGTYVSVRDSNHLYHAGIDTVYLKQDVMLVEVIVHE